jgi:RHS repeat-associated protein
VQGVQPQYEFNGQNQIDVSNVSYDAAGNILTDGVGLGNTYTYDAENRMITAANGYSDSYVYDAFGHRVGATVNGQVYGFLYDLAGRTVDQLTSTAVTRSEAYAGAMHVATYVNGTPYFDNGDWESTFRVRGSASASNLETCTSLPFGEDLTCNMSLSSEVSPLHFTGQEHDSESGDDRFPFRYYNEVMGRWLTPDPAGLAAVDPTNPQSWNRYAYVLNNPLSNIDPFGLDCVTVNADGSTSTAIGDCDEMANNQFYFDGNVNGNQVVVDNDGNVMASVDGNLQCSGDSGCASYNSLTSVTVNGGAAPQVYVPFGLLPSIFQSGPQVPTVSAYNPNLFQQIGDNLNDWMNKHSKAMGVAGCLTAPPGSMQEIEDAHAQIFGPTPMVPADNSEGGEGGGGATIWVYNTNTQRNGGYSPYGSVTGAASMNGAAAAADYLSSALPCVRKQQ